MGTEGLSDRGSAVPMLSLGVFTKVETRGRRGPQRAWVPDLCQLCALGAGGSAGLQPLRPQTLGLLGFNRQRQVPVPGPALMGPS